MLLLHLCWSQWSPGASLFTGRQGHTATLLHDNNVLVCGGVGSGVGAYLASCELFESSSGLFSATGTMMSPRSRHTASLLQNDDVIVCGGEFGGGYLKSCEIYNSVSRTFSATGNMSVSRQFHSATSLISNDVLVCGGANQGIVGGCEIFNSTTGVFSFVGNLWNPRKDHTASLLSNSSVLICGGQGLSITTLASCEMYSPQSGLALSAMMLTTRAYHSATFLNNGDVLICGGIAGSLFLSSCEFFDRILGVFVGTGTMSNFRKDHTASLLINGNVLICGGFNDAGVLANCEIYKFLSRNFANVVSLSIAREDHTAIVLNSSCVLVCGGYSPLTSTYLTSCEVFTFCFEFVSSFVPSYSCVSSTAQLRGYDNVLTGGIGSWSATGGILSNQTDPNATFTSGTIGSFSLTWASIYCSFSKDIIVLAPPTAAFTPSTAVVNGGAGCGNSYGLNVVPGGDTNLGSWNGFQPGIVTDASAYATFFFWSPVQVGQVVNISYSPNSVCKVPAIFALSIVNVSCTNQCASVSVSIPDFGCISRPVRIDAKEGSGRWSSTNGTTVTISNNTALSTTFTSSALGATILTWTTATCNVSHSVTILAPPTASFSSQTISGLGICGTNGSTTIGVFLVGDAVFGKWQIVSGSGSFSNDQSGFTLYTWASPGLHNLSFTPASVCDVPAFIGVQVVSVCPLPPLSYEALIGVSVGAVIGGLIFVSAIVIAVIYFYRVWNRSLVKFRGNGNVAMTSTSTSYRF